MNMFDNAKLVKRNGKYAVQLDSLTVELSNGSTVKFAFPGHVCHVFSKETGVNLEA